MGIAVFRPAHRPVGLSLGRSPLAPRTIARGAAAGLALAAAGSVFGWWLAGLTPLEVDAQVLDRAEVSRSSWVFGVARLLGYLGHALVVAPVALALAVLARRRWGGWNLGLLLLVALGGATAVTGVVKLVTDRARPDDALVSTLSSAFPSGHAVRAAAVYGLVAWLVVRLARNHVVRRLALSAATAVVVLNGVARVALGAHWPTDVLAGFVIGAVWLAGTLAVLRPRPIVVPAAQSEAAVEVDSSVESEVAVEDEVVAGAVVAEPGGSGRLAYSGHDAEPARLRGVRAGTSGGGAHERS